MHREVEREDDFVVVVAVAGRVEPKALIERPGLTVSFGVAREQFGRALCSYDVGDEVHCGAAESTSLVLGGDDQLPQEPRADDSRGIRGDVPAEHHEANWFVIAVDRAKPRLALWDLFGVLQRAGDCAHESALSGRDGQRDHRRTVGRSDLAERHP